MLSIDSRLVEVLRELMVLTESEHTIGAIFGVLAGLPDTVRTLMQVLHSSNHPVGRANCARSIN